jgi:cell division protein FtsI/penicillin-binding protein 2
MTSIRPSHLRRLFLFALVFGICFFGLGARLIHLQILQHQKYRGIAALNTERVLLKEPRRGEILDIHGNPLATSVPVKKVFANPRFLGVHYPDVARAVAPLLGYSEMDLAALLRPTVVRTNVQGIAVTNGWVNLKRKVSLEQWQQITQAMAQLNLNVDESRLSPVQKNFYRALHHKSIYAEDDQQRVYPSGNLASHVLGFVQERETEFNNISTTELIGRDGIERWLDTKLKGVRGWRVTETDRRQREIVVNREQEVESRPGLSAVLTIDMVIQNIVETHLAEAMKKHATESALAVVIRPRTGEILAMATLPDYDPNHPGDFSDDHRRNRVIADVMEPGSTFKIVVVSAALNEQLVTMGDTFFCENGVFYYLGRPLRDHGEYGTLTVEGIITKSSNIGAAKIAIYRLGQKKMLDYISAFGFGAKTGITLDGEVRGIVNEGEQDKLAISRIPMGHAVSVTPLQMTMAMCAIANEGRLMRPMLIHALRDHNGQVFARYQPQVVRQVISERTAKQMVSALKTVVSKDGTAPKAALDHYTVAGKTGTAQKVINRQYPPGKYIASFIGFFPAHSPEVCISVVLDEPDVRKGYYGGQIASPIFKAIAEQVADYLKIRPDRDEPPNTTMAGGVAGAQLKTASVRP